MNIVEAIYETKIQFQMAYAVDPKYCRLGIVKHNQFAEWCNSQPTYPCAHEDDPIKIFGMIVQFSDNPGIEISA